MFYILKMVKFHMSSHQYLCKYKRKEILYGHYIDITLHGHYIYVHVYTYVQYT